MNLSESIIGRDGIRRGRRIRRLVVLRVLILRLRLVRRRRIVRWRDLVLRRCIAKGRQGKEQGQGAGCEMSSHKVVPTVAPAAPVR